MRSGLRPMMEYRPRTSPPSTDSSRKLIGRGPAILRKAETSISRSDTSGGHMTWDAPSAELLVHPVPGGSICMCGKSVDVAAAGLTTRYLVQGVLIDAHTVLRLEVSNIFRCNFFRHSAIERLDHALGVG